MKGLLMILGLALLLACGDTTVSPDPPDIPIPEPPSTPSQPVRVDELPDLHAVRGCTAFGMTNLNEQEMVSFIYHAQARGCTIFRVGAQTDGWAGHHALYLAASAGPTVFTPEWRSNLKRLFDVTSRIPGASLQVIPTFTHKHEGYARNLEITKAVVAIWQAGSADDPTPYRHIVWEAVNEYKHPLSKLTERNVANLLKYLRTTGQPVGTDAPMRSRAGVYPEELLPLVDYVAFHPARNNMDGGGCKLVRPDYNAIRKTVRRYAGKPVWFDEPIAYISDESKSLYGIERSGHYAMCALGTEHQRKKILRDYMWDVEHAGGVWFTHASWLFECRNLGWLAQ